MACYNLDELDKPCWFAEGADEAKTSSQSPHRLVNDTELPQTTFNSAQSCDKVSASEHKTVAETRWKNYC